MELTKETDVRLTTTRRFEHVGICIFGKFHPCAEKSTIFVRFGLVANIIGAPLNRTIASHGMGAWKQVEIWKLDYCPITHYIAEILLNVMLNHIKIKPI